MFIQRIFVNFNTAEVRMIPFITSQSQILFQTFGDLSNRQLQSLLLLPSYFPVFTALNQDPNSLAAFFKMFSRG